jgi:hypothetical protein
MQNAAAPPSPVILLKMLPLPLPCWPILSKDVVKFWKATSVGEKVLQQQGQGQARPL